MSLAEPVTTLDHIASAIVSGKLVLDANRTTDLDYLIALGMAAIRVNRAAAALLHLELALDRHAYNEAKRSVIAETRKLFPELLVDEAMPIALTALKHHINPICPKCMGQKYKVVEGTNRLSDTQCSKCHGAGTKPLPLKDGRKIAEVIARIQVIEHSAQRLVRMKTRVYEPINEEA